MRESANLNDYRKMASEFFDELDAFNDPIFYLTEKLLLKQDDIIILNLLSHIAFFDSLVVQWKEKKSMIQFDQ